MKGHKAFAKLNRRRADYDNNIAKQNRPGYRRPGSLKK